MHTLYLHIKMDGKAMINQDRTSENGCEGYHETKKKQFTDIR